MKLKLVTRKIWTDRYIEWHDKHLNGRYVITFPLGLERELWDRYGGQIRSEIKQRSKNETNKPKL